MSDNLEYVKDMWLLMLEPPWTRDDGNDTWPVWLLGWAWALAGLVLGALAAPPLIQAVGLVDTSYQDWLVIAIAALAGFVVQLLGWVMVLAVFVVGGSVLRALYPDSNTYSDVTDELEYESVHPRNLVPPSAIRAAWFVLVLSPFVIIVALAPFAGIGYSIYLYLTWVGPGQRSVNIAFTGGLLVKTFAIPLIKGIVTGALFRWFMRWLRGGKDTKNA